MNYTPDLRTPIVHVLSSQNYHPVDHPRMMNTAWADEETADAHLTEALERMTQTDRGIFAMPMGKLPGWYASSQWHTGETWRQELLVSKINDWCRAKHGRTIELFIGCRVARSPYHLFMAGSIPPDPANAEAMRRFIPNVLPWVSQIKLHRLILDNSATSANYPAIPRLAEWCQTHWGLTIAIEAYLTIRNGADVELVEEAMELTPSYATSAFIQSRDPTNEWVVPQGAEALAIMRNPEIPTQEWVDSLRQRGFTVGSLSPQCDKLVV